MVPTRVKWLRYQFLIGPFRPEGPFFVQYKSVSNMQCLPHYLFSYQLLALAVLRLEEFACDGTAYCRRGGGKWPKNIQHAEGRKMVSF